MRTIPEKNRKAVIFGTAGFAEVAGFLLTHDSDYEVVAYTSTAAYIESDSVFGKPLVAFEDIESRFPPGEFEMYIAVGYVDGNRTRERFYNEAKSKGYRLLTYISSHCTNWATSIGDNTFVFEDNTLQPFVTIGNNVVLWSGNHIGHHSVIEDHCFISSHVVVSGHCRVGANTFMGVNATMRDSIAIGRDNVIGANALMMKPTRDGRIWIGQRATQFKKRDEA